ncbi:MAG TPA: insulinase family protein, partial [Chlamydiales bacterium]
PENVFCLSFQTLPSSSNGVAHILEHTVLCGSKKFPVKDPFFSMTRRSLNTFMNAFTGQDFTCYPASSQVEKDFYNLLEVYLDAVFSPQLKKLSFLQEGHRLEWVGQNLEFKGVVYNEMKGAMTEAEARLSKAVFKHLTPDLTYAHNAGGEPREIPQLTHEELVEFHQSYYHPSRCLFYFYGNLPLAKHLDFIQAHALEGVKSLPPLPPLPHQERFGKATRFVDRYPAAAGEKQGMIAFGWLTVPISHQSDLMALCLLDIFLMETDASPLKKALLDSHFCKEAESSIDVEMSEAPFLITCKGCDVADEKKLETLLLETLRHIASSPLDPQLVEAALHQLEFQRTEIGGDEWPFGLTLFMRAALIKQHGNQPEEALFIHSLFSELRDRLKDPFYLPNQLKKHLIENTHRVTVSLLADPALEKEEAAEEKASLQKIQENLSAKEKEEIVFQTKELLKYQEAIEHQSLDCLPKVNLSDIPPLPKEFPLSRQSHGPLDVYHHNCFTNQIVYADLLFDLPELKLEELPLVSLLARSWTELGCAGKNYEQTLQSVQASTGGIDAHLALHLSAKDPNLLLPAFSLRGKALDRNAKPFFQLLFDFANAPDFSDRRRLKQWLLQHASDLEENLTKNSLSYATQAALSSFSVASTIYNQWNGFPYYQYVQSLLKKDAWIEQLAPLAAKLVSGTPHLILASSAKTLETLQAHDFYALGSWKKRAQNTPWKGNYPLEKTSSRAEIISSPVAFTALGMRTSAYKDPGVAELMISTELLENVVLHKEIREKGGAYGSRASYSPTSGNYHLSSYRDPNLSQTIATFHKAIDQIAQGQFSTQDLEEAKLGLIAAMDTPVTPGGRAIVSYAWLRSHRTFEDRVKLRREIVSATKEQVMHVIQKQLQNLPSTTISFLGKELWEREKGKCPVFG